MRRLTPLARWRSPRLAAIPFLALLLPASAHAHDLSIDQLRLWIPPPGGQLRGQLTFDPELTRSLETELPDELARKAVTDFVSRQLSVDVNGQRCVPELGVRELYERGGASPGDVVMLSCPLPHEGLPSITVSIADALPALVVFGVGMNVTEPRATPSGAAPMAAGVEEGWPGVATIAARGSVSFRVGAMAADSDLPAQAQSPTGLWGMALVFLRRGVEHVLPSGIDHLLFVASITLGTHRSPRRLLVSLGLFTLGHTGAVAWAANGSWVPPPGWIEPCIAASIALAGFAAYRGSSWLHAARLVFVFGLVHGLGFAGGLAPIEAPFAVFTVSVVGFNVGVEVGQLTAVLAVLGALYVVRRVSPKTDTSQLASWLGLAIAVAGTVWTLLRLTGLSA